ncbi:putative sulfate transporter protein [Phaeoacremonium minimum UCRPA7]|uniref:Putative sulfate transporter protein n=1 Tax=Phaeoacremonium minimum (strain UCR-PA7) TaxID=1286976 RepID=R8BV21_PHAM7|nr:putative sulfate transporter protein [Phaeoacremonium minimum UCRPA7]EOO03144.1 putative sulfate transporter protein [Phaeoacremonium minimum UCRPA7]
MGLRDIRSLNRHNAETFQRAPVAEISGALGDLGTLLPLMIALALQGSISLSTTLVFSGFYNVATGVVFGIPLPVQPMKAIAAAAIASHSSLRTTVAAGALVGAAVLILSVTGLIRWLTRHIPIPVVKGIQFGAGLSLIISAGSSLLRPLGWVVSPFDNRLWALAAFLALIITARLPRFPYALLMFLVGLILAVAHILTHHHHHTHLPWFSVWHPFALVPRFSSGDAWGMALAQLPLTTLNSVIAASALAGDLMPELPAPSVTELGISVAGMNLLGCWFGAMPVCHGAGGLAAQFRFGARSGASIILLGLFKIVLGVVFGETLLDLVRHFPHSILGIMVIAAGLELAKVGQSLNHGAADLWEAAIDEGDNGHASSSLANMIRKHRDLSDDERLERWTVMLMTTAGILAFKNDAVGFAAGMLCHGAYEISHIIERRRTGHTHHGIGESEPLLH